MFRVFRIPSGALGLVGTRMGTPSLISKAQRYGKLYSTAASGLPLGSRRSGPAEVRRSRVVAVVVVVVAEPWCREQRWWMDWEELFGPSLSK